MLERACSAVGPEPELALGLVEHGRSALAPVREPEPDVVDAQGGCS